MLELTTPFTEKHVSSWQGRSPTSIITATFNASDQLPGLIDSLRAHRVDGDWWHWRWVWLFAFLTYN